MEGLEDRTVLSPISWNTTLAPTGRRLGTTKADWVGGVLPTSADDVTIDLTSGTVTHNTSRRRFGPQHHDERDHGPDLE